MSPEELEDDRADYFNRGIEEAAHLLDVESARQHGLAANCSGKRQEAFETDARYVALLATLIREKKK